jgi:hypothetical protein
MKYLVNLPPIIRNNLNVDTTDDFALMIRNRFRTVLDPEGTGEDWLVGDLARFQVGFPYAYGFGIYHRIDGVNTGPAWLLIIPGMASTTIRARIGTDLFGSTVNSYARSDTNGTSFIQQGSFFWHYCETGGTTDPYDFGYDAEGALPGGDLSPAETNPISDLVGFMPANTFLYGYCSNTWFSRNRVSVFMDHENRCAFFYLNVGGQTSFFSRYHISGEIIAPLRAADTYESASFAYILGLSQVNGITEASKWGYCYDDTGTRISLSTENPAIFNAYNWKNAEGEALWIPTILSSSSYTKGFIKDDVMRIIGPSDRRDFNKLYGTSFLKYHHRLGFIYDNEVQSPSYATVNENE